MGRWQGCQCICGTSFARWISTERGDCGPANYRGFIPLSIRPGRCKAHNSLRMQDAVSINMVTRRCTRDSAKKQQILGRHNSNLVWQPVGSMFKLQETMAAAKSIEQARWAFGPKVPCNTSSIFLRCACNKKHASFGGLTGAWLWCTPRVWKNLDMHGHCFFRRCALQQSGSASRNMSCWRLGTCGDLLKPIQESRPGIFFNGYEQATPIATASPKRCAFCLVLYIWQSWASTSLFLLPLSWSSYGHYSTMVAIIDRYDRVSLSPIRPYSMG